MASQLDDAVVRRAVSNRSRHGKSRSKHLEEEEQPKARTSNRQVLFISILMFLCSALIILALISYTSKDEANAELSIRDIIAALRGDDAIKAKLDTTHNWLGLLGAVISNYLYNYTFGYAALTIPLLVGWWAKDLFTKYMIPRKTLERSGLILLCCISVAGWFGSISLISIFPELSREWSGAVGQFISHMLSNFIGSVGAFLVTSVLLFIAIAVTFDVDIEHVVNLAKLYYARFLDWSTLTWKKIRNYDNVKQEEQTIEQPDAEEPKSRRKPKAERIVETEEEETDEPARIIRRNMQNEPAETQSKITDPKIVRLDEAFVNATTGEIVAYRNGRSVLKTDAAQALEPKRIAKQLKEEETIEEADEEYTEEVVDEVVEEYEGEEEYEEAEEETETEDGQTLNLKIEEVYHEEEVEDIDQTNIYDEEIDYNPPGMALLDDAPDEFEANDDELKMNARILQEKLETFKIKIEDVTVTPGPVITQYEFVPAAGVKISQIESLADDIALALKARGIRIIAPIPGKGTVGVEIPNHKPSVVHFSSIIKSKTFNDNDKVLPIALGKTIVGEVFCTDLAKMPHMLIAGSTGSGKSVGINNILMSLMYKIHPRDLKFVIIDPKKVEMTLYTRIKNHFMAMSPDIDETIVTTPQNAVMILKSVVMEMEERYELLASVRQRKITDYNQKVLDGTIKEKDGKVLRPLPFIVVVIDELADLMITARNEVEEPIIRIAQLARAVGIHLVVATQRPSVDVITGLIKANFPARIAYQVASKVDSRTVLDMSGAEQLLGNGDMLFTPGGAKPVRLQNSFISTEEVERITEFIGDQHGYSTPYMLPSIVTKNEGGKDLTGDFDPLFKDAARTIVQFQQGSVSLLQRRLKIGYSRAARIVDELESAGVVGSFDGSKARAVLIESEAELDMHFHTLGM
ncbi:MAG: DNA translocase FtsK 4TM domain-containing protein [Candidatus Kapaibacterium sp.]